MKIDADVFLHEYAHTQYQRYFLNKDTIEFWKTQPRILTCKGAWCESLSENMASWFANWKQDRKTPKEIIKWFKKYENLRTLKTP